MHFSAYIQPLVSTEDWCHNPYPKSKDAQIPLAVFAFNLCTSS